MEVFASKWRLILEARPNFKQFLKLSFIFYQRQLYPAKTYTSFFSKNIIHFQNRQFWKLFLDPKITFGIVHSRNKSVTKITYEIAHYGREGVIRMTFETNNSKSCFRIWKLTFKIVCSGTNYSGIGCSGTNFMLSE